MKIGIVGLNFDELMILIKEINVQAIYVTDTYPQNFSGKLVKEIKLFYPRVNDEECIRCASCFASCIDRALVWTPHGGPRAIPQLCSGCKACYYACKGVTSAIKEDVQRGGLLYNQGNVYVLVSDYQKMSTAFAKVISNFDNVVFSVPLDKGNLASHADKAFCARQCNWLSYPVLSLNELKRVIRKEFGNREYF